MPSVNRIKSRGPSRLAGCCVVGLSAVLALSPAATAATPQTRLILGGSEYTSSDWLPPKYFTPNLQIGAGFFPGTVPVMVDYPASVFGKGTVNQHIDAGVDNLHAAITQREKPLAVVGLSEGSIVLDRERARLENDPLAPAADQLTFVLFASPTRGLLSTLFRNGAHIPVVDITVAPPGESRYDTSVVTHEYDLWGDFPDRPWNLVSLLNAGFATAFVHSVASDVPSDIAPENITTVVNSKGATDTSYFVPTPQLPLTEALRIVGVPGKAVDALDNAIRPVIDAGYSRNDKPGDPRPYLDRGVLTTHQRAALTAGPVSATTPSPHPATVRIPTRTVGRASAAEVNRHSS